jgi:hypothetical protein
MSKILYRVESTEQYDSHVVGIYTEREDAEKRLAMVSLGEDEYTSYAIYEMVIDQNVEKLREDYHSFSFVRSETEKGVEISVREMYDSLHETFHYSERRGYREERISLLARNMEEAQEIFYSERERLIEREIQTIFKSVDLDLNPNFVEHLQKLEAGGIPIVEEKEYYVGNEAKVMDNSIGGLGVFDDFK